MARKLPSSRLPWHPGYPFKPRGGRARRAGSAVVLAALVTLIGTHFYITDTERLRKIAEEQMGKALGGRVKIASARLSIFEGLRLDGVNVYVDRHPKTPDSLLFSAESLQVQVPVGDLLHADLSHATFLAYEPRVKLVKNEEGVYNAWRLYENLKKRSTTRTSTDERVSLPQIILRGGKFELGKVVAGKEEMEEPIALEGTLIPDPNRLDVYTVAASARTLAGRPPATVSGTFDLSKGAYSGTAQNLDLQMARPALPPEVREWIDRHDLTGTISIPVAVLQPGEVDVSAEKRKFQIIVNFGGGGMSLRPSELRPKDLPPLPEGLRSIRFTDVHGELEFSEKGIVLNDISVKHEENEIKVSGKIENYTPDAPFEISASCEKLHVPENPAVLPSLPPEVLEVWNRFLPRGDGAFEFKVTRDTAGNIAPNGTLKVYDGQMMFEKFPMPVHGITGEIVVTNVAPGKTKLEVKNVRGRGAKGTPNETADLRVEGSMFPLEGGSGVDFVIRGDKVVAERNLINAMPPGVQEALEKFAPKTAEERAKAATRPAIPKQENDEAPPVALNLAYPQFGGSFTATIHRDQGKVGNWRWPIDVELTHGTGAFEEFAYPLENVTGKMGIRSGYVTLDGMKTTRGDASLSVSGRVSYGEREAKNKEGKLLYALKIDGGKIPIDQTLVNAIPADQREWLERLGLSGTLDIHGDVTGLDAHYDLGLTVYGGALKPKMSNWSASDVAGMFRLTPKTFTIENATAKRGNAPLTAKGLVDWSGGSAKVGLEVDAKALPLDSDLRSALPEEGKSGWDAVKPEGAADVKISVVPDQPTTIQIWPQGLSATPSLMPVKLTDVRGQVTLRDDVVTLQDLTARYEGAAIELAGKGSSRPRGTWDVHLSAKGVSLTDELRKAMPSMLRETTTALAAKGHFDVDVRRLVFTPGMDGPGKGGAVPGNGADVKFDLTLIPRNLVLSLGVPVEAASGSVKLAGVVRDDRLTTLDGRIDITSATMSGRKLTNLGVKVEKKADQPGMTFSDIRGTLAQGDLVGDAAIALPENGPIGYNLELQLQGADVQTLVGKLVDTPVAGQMTASLRLAQTNVDDPSTRRGAGGITITGDRLAKIPVMLGLVQIANLSLPTFNASFSSAAVQYSMYGPEVRFEKIILQGPGVTIEGDGRLDLEQRVVLMNFYSSRPELLNVPLFGDLLDRASRELLTLEVRGSIDNPRVGPRNFESFSTTVDKVSKSRR